MRKTSTIEHETNIESNVGLEKQIEAIASDADFIQMAGILHQIQEEEKEQMT